MRGAGEGSPGGRRALGGRLAELVEVQLGDVGGLLEAGTLRVAAGQGDQDDESKPARSLAEPGRSRPARTNRSVPH